MAGQARPTRGAAALWQSSARSDILVARGEAPGKTAIKAFALRDAVCGMSK